LAIASAASFHHRAHPGHFENIGLVVDGAHLPAEGARGLDGRVEHAGHHHVDAEDRAAVAFCRRIQARHRLADEVKLAALLERRRGAERQLGGGGGELPVGEPLAARIDDEAVLGAALRDIDAPALRRRAGQHVTCSSARGTQALIERRGRHRGALLLRRRLLPERDLVGRLAGHEPDLDARPIGVELVGENLRQRRVRALPHLRLREGERDIFARRDHDPIGDLVALRGAASSHGDGNEERCRRQRSSGEDEAARHGRHHMLREMRVRRRRPMRRFRPVTPSKSSRRVPFQGPFGTAHPERWGQDRLASTRSGWFFYCK
jgi:hypothetical protein